MDRVGAKFRSNELFSEVLVAARAMSAGTAVLKPLLTEGGGISKGKAVIGDSYDTDVMGARSAGIRPVLLLRGHTRRHDDVDAADGLEQALELIFKRN